MRTWKMQSRLLFAGVILAAAACSDSAVVKPALGPVPVEPLADHNTNGFGALPVSAGQDIRGGATSQTFTVNAAQWTTRYPLGVGTGVIDPFLSIQDNGEEDGFNTDGVWDLDQTRSTFTDALPLNNVPIINESGGQWREFILDANEADAVPAANFSIDLFKMYVCQGVATETFTTAQFLAAITAGTCTLAYSTTSGGTNTGYLLATDDGTSGSGKTLDYRILIPAANFGATANAACQYNPAAAACGYYIVLYSHMGGAGGDFVTGSTFEEYSTVKRPFVAPTKTATTTFTRTYNWTIDKTVTPSTINLWNGDNQNANYTVTVTPTTPTDGSWAVSGTIHIANTSGSDATIASVTDAMTGGLNATVSCPETLPFVLGNNDTLDCTYSRSLPDGTTRTNTATITLAEGTVSTATAQVVFSTPTTEVNKTVNVTDTYPFPGGSTSALGTATAPTPGVFNFVRNYECAAERGAHNNRAIITQTGQFDDASVQVNCYNLSIVKTAVEAQGDVYDWTIDKSVTPASRTMYTGDQGEFQYTVDIDRTGPVSTRSVSGQVTITNSGLDGPVSVAAPTDQVLDGGAGKPAIVVPLNCGATVFPNNLAVGASIVCTYGPIALPNGDDRTNRATVQGTIPVANSKSFSDDETVTFAGVVPSTTNLAVNYADPNDPVARGPFNTDPADFSYINTHACGSTRTIPNTATITSPAGTGNINKSDGASITITCVAPTVVKTAATSYRRTWTWDILKERGIGEPVSLNLQPGQSYIYDFNVNVFTTGNTVDLAEAHGNITTTGNAGVPGARSFTVTDVLTAPVGAAPVVVCPGGQPISITMGANVVCTWSKDLGSDLTARTNQATATLQNVKYQIVGGPTNLGTTPFNSNVANVTFAATATTLIDECVKVGDIAQHKLLPGATNLGAAIINNLTNNQFTQCVNNGTASGAADLDLPYTTTIGPMNQFAACGLFRLDNTATLTTVDLSRTDNSSLTTPITVDCPSGCTLTQGYWKTHNLSFGVKPQGRKGPPVHDWSAAPAWTDWYQWQFFNGTPAPTPDALTPVPLPLKAPPTWFTNFDTAPKGNPYYIASHQFMAALLNKANGASAAIIDAELTAAYTFFLTAIPTTDWSDAQRALLISWGGTFGSYNEGLIGPGHCSEDQTSQQ